MVSEEALTTTTKRDLELRIYTTGWGYWRKAHVSVGTEATLADLRGEIAKQLDDEYQVPSSYSFYYYDAREVDFVAIVGKQEAHHYAFLLEEKGLSIQPDDKEPPLKPKHDAASPDPHSETEKRSNLKSPDPHSNTEQRSEGNSFDVQTKADPHSETGKRSDMTSPDPPSYTEQRSGVSSSDVQTKAEQRSDMNSPDTPSKDMNSPDPQSNTEGMSEVPSSDPPCQCPAPNDEERKIGLRTALPQSFKFKERKQSCDDMYDEAADCELRDTSISNLKEQEQRFNRELDKLKFWERGSLVRSSRVIGPPSLKSQDRQALGRDLETVKPPESVQVLRNDIPEKKSVPPSTRAKKDKGKDYASIDGTALTAPITFDDVSSLGSATDGASTLCDSITEQSWTESEQPKAGEKEEQLRSVKCSNPRCKACSKAPEDDPDYLCPNYMAPWKDPNNDKEHVSLRVFDEGAVDPSEMQVHSNHADQKKPQKAKGGMHPLVEPTKEGERGPEDVRYSKPKEDGDLLALQSMPTNEPRPRSEQPKTGRDVEMTATPQQSEHQTSITTNETSLGCEQKQTEMKVGETTRTTVEPEGIEKELNLEDDLTLTHPSSTGRQCEAEGIEPAEETTAAKLGSCRASNSDSDEPQPRKTSSKVKQMMRFFQSSKSKCEPSSMDSSKKKIPQAESKSSNSKCEPSEIDPSKERPFQTKTKTSNSKSEPSGIDLSKGKAAKAESCKEILLDLKCSESEQQSVQSAQSSRGNKVRSSGKSKHAKAHKKKHSASTASNEHTGSLQPKPTPQEGNITKKEREVDLGGSNNEFPNDPSSNEGKHGAERMVPKEEPNTEDVELEMDLKGNVFSDHPISTGRKQGAERMDPKEEATPGDGGSMDCIIEMDQEWQNFTTLMDGLRKQVDKVEKESIAANSTAAASFGSQGRAQDESTRALHLDSDKLGPKAPTAKVTRLRRFFQSRKPKSGQPSDQKKGKAIGSETNLNSEIDQRSGEMKSTNGFEDVREGSSEPMAAVPLSSEDPEQRSEKVESTRGLQDVRDEVSEQKAAVPQTMEGPLSKPTKKHHAKGKVWLVRDKKTGVAYGLKRLSKNKLKKHRAALEVGNDEISFSELVGAGEYNRTKSTGAAHGAAKNKPIMMEGPTEAVPSKDVPSTQKQNEVALSMSNNKPAGMLQSTTAKKANKRVDLTTMRDKSIAGLKDVDERPIKCTSHKMKLNNMICQKSLSFSTLSATGSASTTSLFDSIDDEVDSIFGVSVGEETANSEPKSKGAGCWLLPDLYYDLTAFVSSSLSNALSFRPEVDLSNEKGTIAAIAACGQPELF